MPSRLPLTSTPNNPVGDQPVHVASRTIASPALACRAAPSKRSIAMSAVAFVNTSGVLVTVMPRAPAAARST